MWLLPHNFSVTSRFSELSPGVITWLDVVWSRPHSPWLSRRARASPDSREDALSSEVRPLFPDLPPVALLLPGCVVLATDGRMEPGCLLPACRWGRWNAHLPGPPISEMLSGLHRAPTTKVDTPISAGSASRTPSSAGVWAFQRAIFTRSPLAVGNDSPVFKYDVERGQVW